MKPDCPVKDVPKVKKEVSEDTKTKDPGMKIGDSGGPSMGEASGGTSFVPPATPPSEDLVKEAVQLLKSLRPSVKMIGVRSVNPAVGHVRALLDGGATHVLRPARSKKEYEDAIPIKVELLVSLPCDRWRRLGRCSPTLTPKSLCRWGRLSGWDSK